MPATGRSRRGKTLVLRAFGAGGLQQTGPTTLLGLTLAQLLCAAQVLSESQIFDAERQSAACRTGDLTTFKTYDFRTATTWHKA
jgi:hypothetical protein